MKLRFVVECNKMKQNPEKSTSATYKRLRIAIFSVGTILLHAIAAVTVEATVIAMATTAATMLTTVAATPSLNPSTPGFLRRSIRVGHNNDAVIVCKTSDPTNTWFHEVIENKKRNPLNVKNGFLNHYAMLPLKGIKQNATYRCMQGAEILSETILTIAAPGLTSPEQIQLGSGDDAALAFVHNGVRNISYFKQTLPGEYSDYRDEKIDIIEVDSQTTILLIRNASAQKSVFTFTYEDNRRSNEWELDVGKAPESVNSFLCRGENYEYMRCAISFPPNNLPTEYKITYKTAKNLLSCKLDEGPTDSVTLFAKNTDNCTYFPNAEIYKFTLIATNVLGEFTNEFSINNHEHVVPSKLQVDVSDINSNSVRLSWDNDLKYYYIYGLEYDITVKPDGFEKYVLYVRARVALPKSEWNEPTQLVFVTAQRTPDRAPNTFVGGFYINDNEITLYWEGLAAYERNGKNFTYVIQELDMQGRELYSTETEETSVDFRWFDTPRIYKIFARNAVGASPNESIIQVVPPKDLNPPLEIEKLFENGAFKLKWKHPRNFRKQPPNNYTVFWCQPMLMKKTECEGPMHFKVVESTITEYTMHSKGQHIMAVAANYPIGSSGLYWTTCFADLNVSLEKVTLEATAISESSIYLKWFNPNCMSAFDGYNITYCVLNNETASSCHSKTETFSRSKGFTLTNLKTYTFYGIKIQLYGTNNRKSPPSTVVVCQTNEAAPEPPTNLNYLTNDVTSHSAKISWEAPTETNGVLKKYYIWYKKYNEKEGNYIEIPSTNLSYTITELSSGSVYEVWLTAWTSKQSIKSASLNITTMIGIPTPPKDVNLVRDGGDYVLSWTAAESSAGHIEFYELIFNDNNLRQILTVQRVSGSGERHECRLKYPDCTEGVQNMQVRAINVVTENDLDKSAFAIGDEALQRHRRHTDPAYIRSTIHTQATNNEEIYKGYDIQKERIAVNNNKTAPQSGYAYKYQKHNDFECEQVDESIRTQLPYMDNTRYYMLKSKPTSSANFNCSTFPWKTLAASFIFVSMFIATILWSYNVVQRQWKVHVQLPESVLQLMSMSTKLPSCLEDNKPGNISIVSTKGSDGTSLINIGNISVPSSSSESGVDGVGDGDGDSDTPSTSSEDVNREFSRCWGKSEPASPQTTITLNSLSQSSHQQSPLHGKKGPHKPIIINDDYLQVEQIKPIIINDSSTSSESSYLPLHSITSKSSSASENFGNKKSVEGYVTVGDLASGVMTQMTNNNDDNNNNNNNNNVFKNAALANGYVLPDSLHKMPTAHTTSIWEDHNQPEKTLQKQFPQRETMTTQSDLFKNLALSTGDYVLPDELPKIAASHSIILENEKSLMPLPQQHLQTSSTLAQPSIFKNMALTNGGYVLPDALTKIAVAQNATSEGDNDDSQMPLQQQVQPIVSYGYVTSDFWSQQNAMK